MSGLKRRDVPNLKWLVIAPGGIGSFYRLADLATTVSTFPRLRKSKSE